MRSVHEVSRKYGITSSTIYSAINAGLLSAEAGMLDDQSEQFKSWYAAHLGQSRVKGNIGMIKEMAQFAAKHRISIHRRDVPSDYAIKEPFNLLFSILEASSNDLDFAQASSAGEMSEMTGCRIGIAQEYVSLFYQQIGGSQADDHAVTKILGMQQKLRAAYLVLYRGEKA
jgi:hypothetical protein